MEHTDLPDLTVKQPFQAGLSRALEAAAEKCQLAANTTPSLALAAAGFKPGPAVRCGFRAVRRDAALTDRVLGFLSNRHQEGPCLALALDVVRDIYAAVAN
jgi:hypothetical protein